MTKKEERRPILAIVAEQYNGSVVQEATGIKISENEFTKTQRHASWPAWANGACLYLYTFYL
jgi:hypothetical protein